MTIKTLPYRDLADYRANAERGFSALHQTHKFGKLYVTWVNGNDDPDINPDVRHIINFETLKDKRVIERNLIKSTNKKWWEFWK